MVKITSKQARDLVFDDCLDEGFSLEEDGGWEQNGKHQYNNTIFKYNGKFYELTVSRSGSPYTDWDYEWEWANSFDCHEVEKVEVTRTEWRNVNG